MHQSRTWISFTAAAKNCWLHHKRHVVLCLQRFGLKTSALGQPGDKVPTWLLKWAALVLGFVEQERKLLPAQLLALRLPLVHYTPLTAAAEAKGELPSCLLFMLGSHCCRGLAGTEAAMLSLRAGVHQHLRVGLHGLACTGCKAKSISGPPAADSEARRELCTMWLGTIPCVAANCCFQGPSAGLCSSTNSTQTLHKPAASPGFPTSQSQQSQLR